jgi:hypothetical protein
MFGAKSSRLRGPEAGLEHDPHIEVVSMRAEVALIGLGEKPVGFLLGKYLW